MADLKILKDFQLAVYDRSSPYNGDFADSESSSRLGLGYITIFEKGRKIKIYPDEKKIEILSENSQVFFDVESKSLIKYDVSTGSKLPLCTGERFFYLKIFFEYIGGIRSWTPGARFE
jgi:hypothetical protein